jgi:hypothetical protein
MNMLLGWSSQRWIDGWISVDIPDRELPHAKRQFGSNVLHILVFETSNSRKAAYIFHCIFLISITLAIAESLQSLPNHFAYYIAIASKALNIIAYFIEFISHCRFIASIAD